MTPAKPMSEQFDLEREAETLAKAMNNSINSMPIDPEELTSFAKRYAEAQWVWRPIEQADMSKRYLLTDGESVHEGYYAIHEWIWAHNENLAFATHYMPLPEPPATSVEAERRKAIDAMEG